jgi:hypothetical protein
MRFRTVATSELVVPRSMPTASRCSRATGASGSEICRSAISAIPDGGRRNRRGGSSSFHPVEHHVDVIDDLGQEAQLAHRSPRAVPCAIDVEQRCDASFQVARFGAHFVDDGLECARVAALGRIRRFLSPLELPLQELERERGIGLVECIDAVQRQRYCARATGSLSVR